MIVENNNNDNNNRNNNKSKRRKLEIDDNDIIVFKNELLQYLNNEKTYIINYDIIENGGDSEAEKTIKNLSLWLRKTYSYNILRQLLFLKEVKDEILNVDTYWLLHMTCTLHFSDYIVNIENVKLVDYLRDSINNCFVSKVDKFSASIMSSIILFIFDITINYNDENFENKNIISNQQIGLTTEFSFNKLLDCNKCHQILEEIVIRTCDSNIFEYSNSTKELYDAIKNTRNLKKIKGNINSIENFALDQSPLQPIFIGNKELQIFITVLKIISRSSNLIAVKEWRIRQLCRLSSCILNSSLFDSSLLDDFEYFIKDSLLLAINRELRSSSVSSLDFTFNTWLIECCKANETTGISSMLNILLIVTNGNTKTLNYEIIESLIRLATLAANDGVAEDSSIQWLRSVCLIQQIAIITQNFEDNSHSNKVDIGFKLLSNWFDIVLGPISNHLKQQEMENIETITSKSFGFACLAFCEIVDIVSEECLQMMCNAVRSRKDLNKDAADSFLQVGRSQLKIFVALRKGNNDNTNSRVGLEINEKKIIQWCRTLDSTGSLPIAVNNQCTMFGVNGHKALMSLLKLLIAENPAIRDSCNKIVIAMSNSKIPLCSNTEAKEFIADEITYEGKLDVILATLSIPVHCKVHVKSALQALQIINDAASKVIDPSTNMSNILLNSLETWKSSCRQAVQSINTFTSNYDLRLKINGLLIMNLMQSITLLASQLHIYLSSSPIATNESTIFWYEWIYEAIDIFSDDNDAVDNISSIICSYLIGDSIGIIQFPGLALLLSLANEQFVLKLLSTIFINFSENISDFNNSVVQKLCGLIHGALTWSSHSFNSYNSNSFLLGDYLKAFQPLLSATYIWIYTSLQTPLPNDFSNLIETICPIINNVHGNNCSTLKLLNSPFFNTVFQWSTKYKEIFGHNCIAYKLQSLIYMLLNTLGSEIDISNMKSVKPLHENCRILFESHPKDSIIYWYKLVECISPLIEFNVVGKACMNENVIITLRSLIKLIAKEIDLYKNDIWKIWMKSAKLEIEKDGNHRKSSILLILALTVINEGNHDINSFSIKNINLSEYTLWCSYLLSSKHMTISKSINIELCDGCSMLYTLSPHLSLSILSHQIPLLISSEVCNQIIIMGSKLYSKIQSNINMTTMNSFIQCIIEDISFLYLCNTNSSLDSLHLFKSEKDDDGNLYSRTLGWSLLSAASICIVNEQNTKHCLKKITEFYKVTTNEKKQKILIFLVALISSFILSPSWVPFVSILLQDKFEESLISSKILELISDELYSQLPYDIAKENIEKFKEKIDIFH